MGRNAVVHEVEQHTAHVLDVDEVAGLVPVLIVFSVAAEQLHAARGLNLSERVQDHGGHAVLVEFVGAVHVEELEPRPEVRLPFLRQRPRVEVVFGSAVRIQGLEVGNDVVAVDVAQRAVAVGRGRAGVDEGKPKFHTQVPDLLGVVQVQCIQEVLILFRGVGARPEVEDELDLAFVGT